MGTISESITDLAQDLAEDMTWDPSSLHSNLSDKIPPASIPEKVKELLQPLFNLSIPLTPKSIYHDVYIDDIIMICLGTILNIERARHATPLSIHSIFRPLDKNEQVLRNYVLC